MHSSLTNLHPHQILGAEGLKTVYECLNGKGNSCVHGREISKDTITCALDKAFRNNSSEIIKNLQEHYESTPDAIQEYYLRLAIIQFLESEYGIKVGFETINDFKRGLRVRISPDSEYAYQHSGEGTIQDDFKEASDPERYFSVYFDDGYTNGYTTKDLVFADKKLQISSQKSKKEILDKITAEQRKDFLKRIIRESIGLIKQDKEAMKSIIKNNRYRLGDDIIINKKGNELYIVSKKGSKGTIKKFNRDGTVSVNFSCFSTGKTPGESYDIDLEAIDHLYPKKTKLSTDEIDKLIGQHISDELQNVIENKNEDVDSSKYKNIVKNIGSDLLINDNFLLPLDEKNYVLNFSDMAKFVVPELYNIYKDPKLYSSSIMFEPPAERQPNVLRLQLTDGCNYRACTYCNGYKGVPFTAKTTKQFKEHTDNVLTAIHDFRGDIDRVFIGSGNALDVEQKSLKECIRYVEDTINPRRIALYGNTHAILNKGTRDLRNLHDNGLSLIYRGAESGSNDVLKYVNKGYTLEEMIRAGSIVENANIQLSVMLMPGLGGHRYFDAHIKGTISLLNNVHFKYITLMTTNPGPDTKYAKTMEAEIRQGKNRPLTNKEIVQQIQEILSEVTPNGQKIGMFGKEIDIVGHNPIQFKIDFDRQGQRDIMNICKKYLKK